MEVPNVSFSLASATTAASYSPSYSSFTFPLAISNGLFRSLSSSLLFPPSLSFSFTFSLSASIHRRPSLISSLLSRGKSPLDCSTRARDSSFRDYSPPYCKVPSAMYSEIRGSRSHFGAANSSSPRRISRSLFLVPRRQPLAPDSRAPSSPIPLDPRPWRTPILLN